jgi:hypothetical protein
LPRLLKVEVQHVRILVVDLEDLVAVALAPAGALRAFRSGGIRFEIDSRARRDVVAGDVELA